VHGNAFIYAIEHRIAEDEARRDLNAFLLWLVLECRAAELADDDEDAAERWNDAINTNRDIHEA
jgi:hypothetical protein